MEDTFLDGIFLGMTLRSYEILVGTARGVIKTRTLRSSDHVPAAFSERAGVLLEEDQADARSGQQDKGIDPPEAREVLIPPDRLATRYVPIR